MNELTLRVEGGRSAFRPGEQVAGAMTWRLDEPPETLAVRLLWFTQGKGTVDVGVVDEQVVPSPEAFGEQAFSFRLPAGPYSFSGSLISLLWAVEATSTSPDAVARSNLVVSPTLVEVVLGPPPTVAEV